jgi:UDP-N-acetylmuramoyl-L-alanyl-D-glutamate--2,6-diaminopimelate ligase
MRLSELIQGLPILEARGDAEIRGVCVDSRRVQPGDLFVALVGRQQDGHRYLADAVRQGAAAVLTQQPAALLTPDTPFARVPDTRDALWRIAQRLHGDPTRHMLTIGVTGTNGKTTTTHMLQKILTAWGKPTVLIGTLGAWMEHPDGRRETLTHEGEFTTPEVYQLQSLLQQARARGAQAAVMEVSSHALDQRRADGIHFDVGVFTNLTQDHLDYHGTMDAYAAAKLRLFTDLAEQSDKPYRAVINISDEWGRQFAAKAKGAVYTYGECECALVRAVRVEYGRDALRFWIRTMLGRGAALTPSPSPTAWERGAETALTPSPSPTVWERGANSPSPSLLGEGDTGGEGISLYTPLIAPYNLYNALAATTAALALGIPLETIQRGLASLSQVPGRFERAPIDADFTVIVDFAHTPDALERVLQAGRMLNPTRLTALFGCGGDRDPTKRPTMGRIAAALADRVILTSDNPRTEDPHQILQQILAGVPDELRHKVALVEPDRRRAIEYALHTAQAGELILLAGKGHEPYQIIGTEKHPFSDMEVAKEAARAKR